jgi:hypothetical protein
LREEATCSNAACTAKSEKRSGFKPHVAQIAQIKKLINAAQKVIGGDLQG